MERCTSADTQAVQSAPGHLDREGGRLRRWSSAIVHDHFVQGSFVGHQSADDAVGERLLGGEHPARQGQVGGYPMTDHLEESGHPP